MIKEKFKRAIAIFGHPINHNLQYPFNIINKAKIILFNTQSIVLNLDFLPYFMYPLKFELLFLFILYTDQVVLFNEE